MFEQTFVNTQAHARRPWTVAASLTLQTGLVALAVILPMLHPEILHPKFEMPIYLPMRPIAQPAPVETHVVQRTASSTPRPHFPSILAAPASIPRQINMIVDAPDMVSYPGTLPFAGQSSGSFATIPGIGILPERTPPASSPVQPVRTKVPQGPMHVSTGVQSALLVFGPKPQYPPLAKAARIQGTVRIQAIISVEGVIRNLQVISGPPLLVKAALDAVRQWRYRATLLNGIAVEVITEIDVNFTLSQ